MGGEIYFYYLFLPILGGVIPTFVLLKSYLDALKESDSKKLLVPTLFMVFFLMLSIGIPLYGVISFTTAERLLNISGENYEVALLLIKSGGMAMGFGCLGIGLGLAYIFKEAIKEIIVDTKNVVGYFILGVFAEEICLYGLIVMFLNFGKIGTVDLVNATSLYHSTILFSFTLLLSGFLFGYLPTKTGIASSMKGWLKKILFAAVGLIPVFIGLVYEFVVLGRI